MFATAFDMTVADIVRHHPKGVPQTYREIARTLAPFGFERIQGSVYLTRNQDLGNLVAAVLALRGLPWLPLCVRDVRGFKVEHWPDFTPLVNRS
jgi:virulence-associated protein VapD